MLMLILVQSIKYTYIIIHDNTRYIVSDLILMLHSSRARVTQGKIRGPDIIERRVAAQTITTTQYAAATTTTTTTPPSIISTTGQAAFFCREESPSQLLTHCHRTCVNLNKGTLLQKHKKFSFQVVFIPPISGLVSLFRETVTLALYFG